MTDTFGPNSTDLSQPSNLSQCLANKLRVKTDLLGSTLFTLTWKQRATPSGRSIPALRASGRRTSGNGCTSLEHWPTPRTIDNSLESWEIKRKRNARHLSEGKTKGVRS